MYARTTVKIICAIDTISLRPKNRLARISRQTIQWVSGRFLPPFPAIRGKNALNASARIFFYRLGNREK